MSFVGDRFNSSNIFTSISRHINYIITVIFGIYCASFCLSVFSGDYDSQNTLFFSTIIIVLFCICLLNIIRVRKMMAERKEKRMIFIYSVYAIFEEIKFENNEFEQNSTDLDLHLRDFLGWIVNDEPHWADNFKRQDIKDLRRGYWMNLRAAVNSYCNSCNFTSYVLGYHDKSRDNINVGYIFLLNAFLWKYYFADDKDSSPSMDKKDHLIYSVLIEKLNRPEWEKYSSQFCSREARTGLAEKIKSELALCSIYL